jgi:hypothetical protein
MTTKNLNSDHNLVIKCKEITNNFEDQIADLATQARHLSSEDKDKISTELKATIQNINFILTSLFSL